VSYPIQLKDIFLGSICLCITANCIPVLDQAGSQNLQCKLTKLAAALCDLSCSWSVGSAVGYALLAFHSDKIGNVIITAGSPGGPDARLTSLSVVTDLMKIGNNYTALLPYLFPQGPADEGELQRGCVF
jgi:hypothetical protein